MLNKITSKVLSKKILLSSIIIALLFNYITYKELPDDFEQPIKYRLLSFGSDMLSYVGKFVEYFEIGNRIHLTRLAYHFTVGLFNVRNPDDGIEIKDLLIDNVPIRVYSHLNHSNGKVPTIFLYHGGGFFVGSADIYDSVNYLLAKNTKMMVIYIEFRLIPEHPFPAALNDSLSTTLSLLNNHKKYNIDLENVILLGDSAGGNLATVICRKLIELNVARPKLNVLIYPILQFFDFTLPSYIENMPKRVLGEIDSENFVNFIHFFTGYYVDKTILLNGHTSKEEKESHLSDYVNFKFLPESFHFLQRPAQLNSTLNEEIKNILLDSDVSPLLVDDLTLKQTTAKNTFVLTVGLDILRDDSLIYVDRLRRVNASVHHEHYENLFHGIFGLINGPLQFKVAQKLMNSVCKYIKRIII